jgi:hypothetical protein
VEISFRGADISRTLNQRGQGLLEYILILFFILAIIFGGIYAFNDAIKVWANNYFGDYLTCLLETGELPTIGGDPGDSGICDQFFKPFSLSDGRPYKTMTDGPMSNPSGANSAKGANGSNRAVNESSARRSSSGGSGGSGRSGSGNGAFGNSQNANAENGGAGAEAKKENGTYTGSNETENYGGFGNRVRGSRGPEGGQLSRGFYVQMPKDEKEKPPGYAASGSRNDSGFNTPRKVALKPAQKPEYIPPDEPFTIGSFFRFLVIAGIIIAIVFLLGGQLLQISKNMD